MLTRFWLVPALVGSAGVPPGCGSARKPTRTTGSAAHASFLWFSECLRSHGVSNFRDPRPGGGLKIVPGSRPDPQAPAFQKAQQTCRHLLPGGGLPGAVPESVKLAMRKHAQCMRGHGVASYPNPAFPPGGGVENFIPSSVDSGSPSFQHAAKACGGP